MIAALEIASPQKSPEVHEAEDKISSVPEPAAQMVSASNIARNKSLRVADGRIRVVTAIWLGDRLGQLIRFERFDRRSEKWMPTKAPVDLPKVILEREGERDLPKLDAVVTAPIMRRDGSVLDIPGYDSSSQLLYVSDDPAPARVPQCPSMDQIRVAVREVWKPFADFPFVDDESRAVAFAAILTAVVRGSLLTAPGFAFDASVAGTGKTLIAKCIAAIGGHESRITSPPRDDEETRKALFAMLRDGIGCLIWDNVERPLGNDALNAFLTAETFSDRILGVSQTAALPNRALFIATGNNLQVVGDACRRILVCRMDARLEKPYLRQFKFDPLAWVRARRQELARCALTILTGYQRWGCPFGTGSLASFETWDELVRQCVTWIGAADFGLSLGDPVDSVLNNVAEDSAKSVLAAMLEAWEAAFQMRPVLVRDVWAKARGTLSSLTNQEEALSHAIDAIASGDPRFNEQRLGLWLAKHKGEIVNGMYFTCIPDGHTKSKRWLIAKCD